MFENYREIVVGILHFICFTFQLFFSLCIPDLSVRVVETKLKYNSIANCYASACTGRQGNANGRSGRQAKEHKQSGMQKVIDTSR